MISNLCYNYNTSKIKKQDSNLNIYDPTPNGVVRADPYGFFSSLSETKRKLINEFIRLQNKHGRIFVGQGTLASFLGVCRETINRNVRELAFLGIIRKEYRHMNTCLYKVSSYLFKSEIKSQLMGLFSALKYFLSVNKLFSFKPHENDDLKNNVTHINIKDIYIYNYIYIYIFNNYLGRYVLLNIRKKCDIINSSKIDKEFHNNGDHMEKKQFNLPLSYAQINAKNKLSLSQHGIISILQFDDQGITYALNQLRPSKAKREELFRIFCKFAHEWHKNNGVPVNYKRKFDLEKDYPIPANAKYTIDAPVINSVSAEDFEPDFNDKNKYNYKKNVNINHPQPLDGLDPVVANRIKIRREAIANKTYVPRQETREEAFQKIERFNRSPEGYALAKKLGFQELPNPFKDNSNPMTALKQILSAPNKDQDQFKSKIIDDYEYSIWDIEKNKAPIDFDSF